MAQNRSLNQELVRNCRIIGTWDDNDYGMKNQELFLDFLGEPKDNPRCKQRGIYVSYLFGEPGKQTKVVLLDEHYSAIRVTRPGGVAGAYVWDFAGGM